MDPILASAKLNRRISLLEPTTTRSPTGASATTYSSAIEGLPAAKWTLTEKEVSIAAATRATAQCKFMVRYRTDVKTNWRLICDGLTYEITGISEIGRRVGLFLLANEVG